MSVVGNMPDCAIAQVAPSLIVISYATRQIKLIAFVWTLPSAGLLVSALRPPDDITNTGWWTVFSHPFESSVWTLENYDQVLNAHGLANALLNSVLVTVPSVVIPITIAAFAAYAFAWLEFPGRRFFFTVVVGLMVVPLP